MRTGWAQRPLGFMVLQEVRKIWRAISVQSFEGHGGKFKPYMSFDRKPVELFEKFIWRQWRCTRMLVHDNPSRCMLDTLKTSCVLKRSSIYNIVQLIKARRNKCWCDRGSHTIRKRYAYHTRTLFFKRYVHMVIVLYQVRAYTCYDF